MSDLIYTCALCGTTALRFLKAPLFPGVTSDVKPWPRIGAFLCCETCGHIQKRIDQQWRKDTADIYADYIMYHLSDGAEQVVFDAAAVQPRTDKLLETMLNGVALPSSGRLLDVGCGGGAFLRAFSKRHRLWTLTGQDLCPQRRDEVMGIPGVESFHSTGLGEIADSFDAISMIHVLEHMTTPVTELRRIGKLLKPDGLVIATVPDASQTSFDFTVVDHCGHYFAETLAFCLQCAGYEIVSHGRDWLPKETGVIARLAPNISPIAPPPELGRGFATVGMDWLAGTLAKGKTDAAAVHAAGGRFGVLGTANAGTWFASALAGHVDFFVDEDPHRVGKKHLGLPIMRPADVQASDLIFPCFPSQLAQSIAKRLGGAHPTIRFALPPEQAV